MTNIFEYSNIFDPNIYSDIRLYQSFNTNIFGYSFVSKMFLQMYSDVRLCHFLDTNIFGYLFVSKSIQMSHSDLVRQLTTHLVTLISAAPQWEMFVQREFMHNIFHLQVSVRNSLMQLSLFPYLD